MAFQQGLSGLGVASKALDVISSNVANSSTVGFKASGTVFADTYAAAMGGGVNNLQVGMGGNAITVRQSFTQGATTATNNPLDMAIAGNGFFQVQRNNNSTAFTRNGQFDLDSNGYIVTPLGERLMGYQTLNSDGTAAFIGATAPRALQIPPIGIGAKATGTDAVPVGFRGNLNSADAAKAAAPAFSTTDSSTYNFTSSSAIYDSLGNQHAMTLYFRKTAANTWSVYSEFRPLGGTPTLVPATPETLTFDSAGNWATGGPIAIAALNPGSGADPLNFDINLSSFTQRNSGSAVFEITQNGTPPGELASVSVSNNGLVQGRYTNGETRDLGKVILATFRNPNGLASVGDNLWVETRDSGQPALAGPGDGLNGTIGSGRVEESNVDMSQELVQMIIQQRNYQANAQSIKTQDALLQTLINLR
ncbi:flagellar hook protein FlgE [Dechloromonas sp.]|uniref:flagellar hook protein FlgE n=1 Tax=Dechloromonas sp. TaxID=1917218 RepID=UPI002171B940|nr:flagellar hook protein FlgE [Dechloromonas sp.]MBU3696412.1 flagellar hook protein FlgE [Dechloromonas sp.]